VWQTNLKVLLVVVGTVTLYTLVANGIPQVESEVPEQLTFTGEVTADELVQAGEELYQGAGGCVACHGLGTRAPNLLTARLTCTSPWSTRVPTWWRGTSPLCPT
jgi:hypothetical protein